MVHSSLVIGSSYTPRLRNHSVVWSWRWCQDSRVLIRVSAVAAQLLAISSATYAGIGQDQLLVAKFGENPKIDIDTLRATVLAAPPMPLRYLAASVAPIQ